MDDQEDIVHAVLAAASEQDGRRILRCADAFKVAEALDIPLREITRICNHHKVKIVQCQLGCFK